MHEYHNEHPFQYILLVTVFYSLLLSTTIPWLASVSGRRRHLAVVAILVLCVVIASPIGGLLWVLHDIQAGFLPPRQILWNNITWGMSAGLSFGWLIVLLSFPYNLATFLIGHVLALRAIRYYEAHQPSTLTESLNLTKPGGS